MRLVGFKNPNKIRFGTLFCAILTPEIKLAKTGFLSAQKTSFTVLKTGGFTWFSG